MSRPDAAASATGATARVGFLRVPRRLVAVIAHAFHGLWLAGMRLPGSARDARLDIVRHWSRLGLRRLGVDLRVTGTPHEGAVLMVANHVSWLDIPAIHAAAPQVRFVSKSAVAHWPVVGALARAGGTLFIERERKRDALRVVHEVAEALRAADSIAVFPEGTTGPGDTVLSFHANLLQAAIATGTAIQPVVLRYSEPGQHFSVSAQYIGDTTLIDSLFKVMRAHGLVAHVEFLAPEWPAESDRRILARRLHDRIEASLRRR